MAYLVIQSGKHKGRKIPLRAEGEFVIGRDPECDLRLGSTDVSRRHCSLALGRTGVTVRDLDSRNGTFIDGFLIQGSGLLRPGSVLKVGPMEFLLPGKKAGERAKAEPDDPTSDADIASWLTEEGETDQVNLEDSTIIPGKAAGAPPAPPAVGDLERHPDARRAADVIRAHWQQKPSS